MGLFQRQLDEAFKQGGSATDAYEGAKKRQQVTQEGQAERDARLAQLIKGNELQDASKNAMLTRQITEAERMRNQYGKDVPVNIEGVSIGSAGDPLTAFIKGQQLKDINEDRSLRRQERFGNALSKASIPGRASDMAALEAATRSKDAGGMITNKDYQPKSAGPYINAVPNALMGPAVALGEKFGMLPQGAAEERRAIQRIQNVDIKQLSGAQVSAFEEARNKIAQGQSLGGDPALLRQGIQEAHAVLEAEAKNIESAFPQDTKDRYRAEGGEFDVNRMIQRGQPTQQAPAPQGGQRPPTIEEWRASKGRK